MIPLFLEQFEDLGEKGKWQLRWISSSSMTKDGQSYSDSWKIASATTSLGSKNDLGLLLRDQKQHFAISTATEMPFKFKKEGPIVVQYEVKRECPLECSGAYVKLIAGSKEFDPEFFNDETPAAIIFGPDNCGSSKDEIILHLSQLNQMTGKTETWRLKTPPRTIGDTSLSTLYTLIIGVENSIRILVNMTPVFEGSLEADFELVDPKSTVAEDRPAWWDDREYIPDPTAVPALGEDETTWKAPLIKNPKYQGAWKRSAVTQYPIRDQLLPVAGVGFELWSVEGGVLFDNILVTQDLDLYQKFTEATWKVKHQMESKKLSELLSSASTPLDLKMKLGRQDFDWIMAEEIQPSGIFEKYVATARKILDSCQNDSEELQNYARTMLVIFLLAIALAVLIREMCERLFKKGVTKKIVDDDVDIEIPRAIQKSAPIALPIPKPVSSKRDRQFSSPLHFQLSMSISAPPSPREPNLHD